MTTIFDTTCTMSVVRNTSGAARRFTFLPPHGRKLANNEELTVFGSILEAVNRGDRFGRRSMDALDFALSRGQLEIKSLPHPILTDVSNGTVKMIDLSAGALIVVDPCWEVSIAEE